MTGWVTLGCTSSGNCPQIRRMPDGGVEVRSSRRPGDVARLDAGEWAALVEAVRDGDAPGCGEVAR